MLQWMYDHSGSAAAYHHQQMSNIVNLDGEAEWDRDDAPPVANIYFNRVSKEQTNHGGPRNQRAILTTAHTLDSLPSAGKRSLSMSSPKA